MKKCVCGQMNDDDANYCQECKTKFPENNLLKTDLGIGDCNAISAQEVITGSKQVINTGSYVVNQINDVKHEAIIKIISDESCDIYRDKEIEKKGVQANEMTKVSLLKRGEHLFNFQSIEDNFKHIEYIYYVKEVDVEEFLYVNFKCGIVETSSERQASKEQERRSAEKKAKEQLDQEYKMQQIANAKYQQELADLQIEAAHKRKQAADEDIHIPLNPRVPISRHNVIDKYKSLLAAVCLIIIGIGSYLLFCMDEKSEDIVVLQPKSEEVVLQPEGEEESNISPSQPDKTTNTTATTTKVDIVASQTNTSSLDYIESSSVESLTPAPPAPPATSPTPKTAKELYNDGRRLMITNDYKQAVPILERASDMGSVDATYTLGLIYINGGSDGVVKDTSKGFDLVLQAANSEHKEAIFQVAEMYSSGTGITKDKKQAEMWYKKALELGDARAESRLRNL